MSMNAFEFLNNVSNCADEQDSFGTTDFDKFAEIMSESDFGNEIELESNIDFNYHICRECDVAMELSNETSQFICPDCGKHRTIVGDLKGNDPESTGSLFATSSCAGNRRIYHISTDYSRTQKKNILDQLNKNLVNKTGPNIPKNIIAATAEKYNEIQKFQAEKKFVKRGDVKDRIIAAILYYECLNSGVPRRRKEISDFMRLETGGISSGEKTLRELNTKGIINIDMSVDPLDAFIERYLECLQIDEKYRGFIKDIIERSTSKDISNHCEMTSKIIGCINLIISRDKTIGLTAKDLDNKCNIRVNTFTKYSKSIEARMSHFSDIFIKHKLNPKVKKPLKSTRRR